MSALIVLEGLDASGKATQAKLLAEKLDSLGRSAVVMAFPRYGTEVGKAIRRHLLDEITLVRSMIPGQTVAVAPHVRAPEDATFLQAMFFVDKVEAADEIERKLDHGVVVICDRWTPSAICFGEADGLDGAWLRRVNARLPQADLSIFIDVPEEEALRRRPKLRDRYEADRDKQRLVHWHYEKLWAEMAEREPGWVQVDGMGTESEVAARIWEHVSGLVGAE